jgi:hypothetical protein
MLNDTQKTDTHTHIHTHQASMQVMPINQTAISNNKSALAISISNNILVPIRGYGNFILHFSLVISLINILMVKQNVINEIEMERTTYIYIYIYFQTERKIIL